MLRPITHPTAPKHPPYAQSSRGEEESPYAQSSLGEEESDPAPPPSLRSVAVAARAARCFGDLVSEEADLEAAVGAAAQVGLSAGVLEAGRGRRGFTPLAHSHPCRWWKELLDELFRVADTFKRNERLTLAEIKAPSLPEALGGSHPFPDPCTRRV